MIRESIFKDWRSHLVSIRRFCQGKMERDQSSLLVRPGFIRSVRVAGQAGQVLLDVLDMLLT